ncbi:hypothetical protein X777_06989 [Ooceraea biroi]|uniref:Uncharacterized protein n=1 Tax=Ooceraea biroi TaxID=2015173 RepID=A0A026WBU7_OOCBI|nr:hypothetical protein X777_06989 [Ooceraea biroi]
MEHCFKKDRSADATVSTWNFFEDANLISHRNISEQATVPEAANGFCKIRK